MDEAPDISLTKHQRYWLEHVRACEAPGKRITEYATDHGLGVRAMYDGKRVLVKKGVLQKWAPIFGQSFKCNLPTHPMA